VATQQLLFDILATSKGVDKTFQDVVDSADSMAGKLGAAGSKATSALFSPTTAALAGGVAGAALMSGLSTAIDMDSITSTMTAGLNLAGPEAAKAGETAGQMYADGYGDSFDSVAAGVGATLSSIKGLSGASQEDIQSVTSKVMDLSSAFEIDVARTAQVAGQMINTGLAKDGVEAADLLAAALAKVPVNVRADVLDAVDEYGPMFGQLGMSGGEAMTLLADASAQGAFGIDKTGDALKEFTIRATDMSKSSGDAYKTLGMDQTDMSNRILAGGDTARGAFDEIITGLGSMTDPAAQAQAAIALFGTPIEDLGTGKIPGFIDSLLNSQEALGTVEGSAGALGDKLHSGPGAAFTELQRTAETTLGELGAQMLPILTPILEGLQQFAPIIGPAVIALGALAAVIAVVNFVMALNPITWIIVGIVALIAAIVLLVMNWEAVVAFLSQVWGGFVGWFTGVMDGFFGWWNGVWAGFIGWTLGIWGGFTGMLGDVWNGFVGWIMGVIGGFGNFIGSAFSGIVNFAVAVWSGLGSFFGGLWSGIVNGVSGMIGNIGGFFSGLPGQIMGFFSGAGQWLYSAGRNIIDGLLSGAGSLLRNIGNFFADMLPEMIRGPFKSALGIASPSKVFAGYGENIGEGVLVGIGRMQGRIDERMSNLVTVPDLAVTGAFGTSGSGTTGRDGAGGGSTIDDLIRVIREVRPIQVNGTPGMDEELLGRATAEQLLWKG
jgi:phage-related minor tail protein